MRSRVRGNKNTHVYIFGQGKAEVIFRSGLDDDNEKRIGSNY